ncbi:MAG: addiction module protein [Candidatus Sigynarchaeota archaeon]
MSSRINKIEKEALQLPFHERAILAEKLLHSLDEEEDADVERAWIEEAERRYKEYKRGKTSGRSIDEVLREIRSEFQ